MALELPTWLVVAFQYVGLPWPGIDEDQLRAWATSVRGFADQITGSSAKTHQAVAELADSSQSSTINGLAVRWDHHNRLIADLQGPMNDFADALDVAADAVVAQKWAVIGAASALASEFVATQVGAFFTLGADEAALPEEIATTKGLVNLALQELEAELIGKLTGVAAQEINDHVGRFIGNLFDDALPVALEMQSLKISYQQIRSTAQAMRRNATETEESGDTAYDENANRDLDDPSEGTGGRWPVIAAVKQVLEDVALNLFKVLTGAIFRAMDGDAGILMRMSDDVEDVDNTAGRDLEPTGSGNPAESSVDSGGEPPDPPSAGGGQDEHEARIVSLIADSNPNFPLTRVNAERILTGPQGSTADVSGPGRGGADVVFRSGDVDEPPILLREVKCIAGGAQGSFNREVSHAAGQIGYDGEIHVQVPEGTDGLRMVSRFRGARPPEQLARYRSVRIVVVTPSGATTFDGKLAP